MPIDYRSVIIAESASVLGTVRQGPLDALVPGCPGWTLADLAVHLGGVQRWSAHVVAHGEPPKQVVAAPPDPALAAAFFEAGTGPLVQALDAADPDAPCWNFTGANQVVGFWPRRQALEVSCHRWDAQSAVGEPAPIEAVLAADVIDEFVHAMIGRVLARTKADTSHLTGDVHLHCTDTEGEWTFQLVDGALQVGTGHRKAAAAVRGPASDLALFLYNRVPAERVEIFGDSGLVHAWMSVLRF